MENPSSQKWPSLCPFKVGSVRDGSMLGLGKEGHLFCQSELCPRSLCRPAWHSFFSVPLFPFTLRLGIWPHLLVCMALV